MQHEMLGFLQLYWSGCSGTKTSFWRKCVAGNGIHEKTEDHEGNRQTSYNEEDS